MTEDRTEKKQPYAQIYSRKRDPNLRQLQVHLPLPLWIRIKEIANEENTRLHRGLSKVSATEVLRDILLGKRPQIDPESIGLAGDEIGDYETK